MIYSTFTASAISQFTRRHCIRFTEMAYVIVAVFESGRPMFVSKKALHSYVVRQECRNDGKLQAEWRIGVLAGVAKKESGISLEVLVKRVRRAGFNLPEIKGNQVIALIPRDEFDRVVALQCAKENGWEIKNGQVFAAA